MGDSQDRRSEQPDPTNSTSPQQVAHSSSITEHQFSTPRHHKNAAALLQWLCLCLLGAFTSLVLGRILPFNPSNPEWQSRLIDAVCGRGNLALEAAICMLLAAVIAPRNPEIEKRFQLLRLFAGILSGLFFFFIPLQIHSGARLVSQQAITESKAMAILQTGARAIAAADNEAQFREAFRALPGAPRLPAASIGAALPALKANVLQQINTQISRLQILADKQRNNRFDLFSSLALRGSLTSLFYALAFGALARMSLFSSFQASSSNPLKSFNSFMPGALHGLRQRQAFESTRNSRWRSGEADRKRDENRRREMKQRAAERQKALQRHQIERRLKEREQGKQR